MYGIIYQAIKDTVAEQFGEEKWDAVKERSGIEMDFFVATEKYANDYTFKLASAVSKEMNMSLNNALLAFGEWAVLKASKQKYASLIESGGSSLREFLLNLPVFYSHMMLLYPQLPPPEFTISDETEGSIHIHYLAKDSGLEEFVRGMLLGLGKMYNTPVTVDSIQEQGDDGRHEVYKVNW